MKKRSGKPKRKPTPSKGRGKRTREEECTNDDAGITATTVDDGGDDKTGVEVKPAEARAAKPASLVDIAFEKFAKATVAKKLDGLKAEFASLSTFTPPDPASTVFASHKEKNRYHNIVCYDKTRVVLKYQVPPDGDYIHANWVSDTSNPKSNKFICCQAPLDSTVNDFWRMVWQEKPKHIVMLCRTVETGKPKCAQYWPANIGEQKQYGTVTVQNARNCTPEKEKIFESSALQVSVGSESFQLQQHRWLDWPDFGVPTSGMGMLRLLRMLREVKDGPAIIHCSAGVGRTGTLAAVEICLKNLLEGKEVTPLEVVKDIRTQRAGLIQTEMQYLFLHKTLFEYMSAKKMCKQEVTEFSTAYQEINKGPGTPPAAAPSAAAPDAV